MRLTRPGLAAVASVPALALTAWLLGQPELAVAAAAIGATLVGSSVLLLARPVRVEVHRSARPPRVAVGGPCRIRLDVHNVGSRRTPVLSLRDDVGDHGEAVMHLAPLPPGARSATLYSFPTHRRGLHRVGPLAIHVEDPFGLLRRVNEVADVQTVVVRPAVHPLHRIATVAGDEPERGARVRSVSATVDEEFAAMRPYVVGDDIRRIHWRTTARVGHPVIRQFDQPWQRRSTILLDVDARSTDPASFERAVTLAASIITEAVAEDGIVRLLTTDGVDSGFVPTSEHIDALLDRLAAVATASSASLASGLALLGRRPTGRIITVAGRLTPAEVKGWTRATRAATTRMLALTSGVDGAVDPVLTDRTLPAEVIVLRWDGTRPLGDVWATATSAGPTSRAASRGAAAHRGAARMSIT